MKKYFLILMLIGLPVMASHKYLEKDYQRYGCNQKTSEALDCISGAF